MPGYSQFGPWSNGVPPGIQAAFLNPLETFLLSLNSAAYDSSISSNSGVLTSLGQIINGNIILQYPSVQTLSNGSTITIPGPLVVVTHAAAVTGIIMTSGSAAGQVIWLYDISTGVSLTFAASGSHVRNGSNVAITQGRFMTMIWDGSNWGTSANP